jgi:hypothetical protein
MAQASVVSGQLLVWLRLTGVAVAQPAESIFDGVDGAKVLVYEPVQFQPCRGPIWSVFDDADGRVAQIHDLRWLVNPGHG